MGTVHLAEGPAPERARVAIKVLRDRPGVQALLPRFRLEARALAAMSHPSIVRYQDSGVDETGRPYLVMEWVEGRSIVEACDLRRLPLRARLELFLEVCAGVAHAHERQVVHRDLKPANVLVCEDGGRLVPKILDFGLVKALDPDLRASLSQTPAGALIGAPMYMAPEQARGDSAAVDARTDVYALGILLHELLTGLLPFSAEDFERLGLLELLVLFIETERPLASARAAKVGRDAAVARRTGRARLVRALRGDLDAIVARALALDRERRYASVAELAAEIERHLRHEPVAATHGGRAYRLGKWLRRRAARGTR